MSSTSSGKRYAQAFFELAVERGQLDNWRDELYEVEGVLLTKELIGLLENPKLPFNGKKVFIMEKLSKINTLTQNLIFVLLIRGKLKILEDVCKQYNLMADKYSGIAHADVITALPLSDEEKHGLSHRLEEMTGKQILIDNRADPTIVGGFRARIGDMLIDGSVHYRLESLKRRLRQAGD